MFCTNCGAKIIEGSKFCTRCGKPVVSVGAQTNAGKPPAASNPTVSAAPAAPAAPASAPSPQTYAGNGPSAAARKPDTKKLLVPGAVVLAVIIVIILALKGSHGGLSSPEKAFDAYMGGYASGDFDLMLKAYPDFRIEHNGGEENLKAAIADDYEFDFGDYVDSYEFTYKATGHTNLSKEDVESVESDINATFGTDVKITDVAEVDYDLTAKNKADGTENTQSFTGGYAVKYKGKWYYFNVF